MRENCDRQQVDRFLWKLPRNTYLGLSTVVSGCSQSAETQTCTRLRVRTPGEPASPPGAVIIWCDDDDDDDEEHEYSDDWAEH